MIKITSVEIKNFMSIKALEITPKGQITVIKGDNGLGKTSILKAIRAAFDTQGLSKDMIKMGEDKAEIIIQITPPDMTVKRTITEKGKYLDIKDADGDSIGEPQTFLNSILGANIFNPVEFFLAEGSDRRDLLLQALPNQFSIEQVEDAIYHNTKMSIWNILEKKDYNRGKSIIDTVQDMAKSIYDKRRSWNKETKTLQSIIDNLHLPDWINPEKYKDVDREKLQKEYQNALNADNIHKQRQKEKEDIVTKGKANNEKIKKLKAEIEQLEKENDELRARSKQLKTEIEEYIAPDIDSIAKDLNAIVEIEKYNAHAETRNKLDSAKKKAQILDQIYAILTKEIPSQIFAELSDSLPGKLSIESEVICYNGTPIEMLCTTEQINVALAISNLIPSKLDVRCIDGLEALSGQNRAKFIELMKESKMEYFVTRVADCPLTVTDENEL